MSKCITYPVHEAILKGKNLSTPFHCVFVTLLFKVFICELNLNFFISCSVPFGFSFCFASATSAAVSLLIGALICVKISAVRYLTFGGEIFSPDLPND